MAGQRVQYVRYGSPVMVSLYQMSPSFPLMRLRKEHKRRGASEGRMHVVHVLADKQLTTRLRKRRGNPGKIAVFIAHFEAGDFWR